MRSVERPAISAAIAEARDKGDLSENAEYDAAREAQGMLEMRIAKLEDSLANARVIDESKIDKSKVQILSKVSLLNHNTKKEVAYTIVAEHEPTCARQAGHRHADRQSAAGAQERRLRRRGGACRDDPLRDPRHQHLRRPIPQGSGPHRPLPAGCRTRHTSPFVGYFCRTVLCGPFFVLLLAAER